MEYTMMVHLFDMDITMFERCLRDLNIEFENDVINSTGNIKYTFKNIDDYETAFDIYIDL